MMIQEPTVYCWGCGKLILVPFIDDDKPAQLFKCGFCEGINNLQQQPLATAVPPPLYHGQPPWPPQTNPQQLPDYYSQQQHHWQQEHNWQPLVWQASSQPTSSASLSQGQHTTSSSKRQSCSAVLLSAWRWLVVGLVMLLIGSISWCGLVLLLPLVCTTWPTYLPNVALGLLLIFQVGFNYAAAMLRPAGRVEDHASLPPRTPDGVVLQGSLQHWSFCRHCKAPKPPQAHHCRTCRTCVMKLDHHCVFIGNCVGQGNLHSFLLFLLWVLLAALYIMVMCSLLVWQNWAVVKASVAAGRSSSSGGGGMQDLLWHQQTPVIIGDAAGPFGGGGGRAGVSTSAGGTASISSAGTSSSSSSSTRAGGGGGGLGDGVGHVVSSSSSSRHWRPAELWLVASTGIFFMVLQSSPWWLLVAYYLVAVSLGVLFAVGVLLGSQLYYLAKGVSYVEYLQQGATAVAAADEQQQFGEGRQQAAKKVPGRWLGGWLRRAWGGWWGALLGDVSQAGPCRMLQALVVPCWQFPAAEVAKKWS